MKTSTTVAGALAALLIVAAWSQAQSSSTTPAADGRPDPSPGSAASIGIDPQAETSPATGDLLRAGPHGDGDSWRDTDGREYRLGLVNAPETDECFGPEANAERKELVAAGFRAEIYTRDRYGRNVAVVTTADGRNVNVILARHGFANDRYLARYRHENPSLARQLDEAFAAAKAERTGLWGACPQPAAAAPGYGAPPAAKEPEPATGASGR